MWKHCLVHYSLLAFRSAFVDIPCIYMCIKNSVYIYIYAYSKICIHVYIHVFYVICEYVFTSLVHKSHKFPLLVSLGCRRAALNPPPAYQAQGPGQGGYQGGGAFETAKLIETRSTMVLTMVLTMVK